MKRRHTMMEGRSMKKVLLGVTVVLLLAGAGFGAWYLTQQPKPTEKKKSVETQKLEQKLAQAKSDEQKAAAYRKLVNHYVNKDNGDKAVDYAQKAVEATPSAEAYAQLGFAATQAGDDKAAIAAYEKAAALAKAAGQTDDGRSDLSYYLMQARLLKEGKA